MSDSLFIKTSSTYSNNILTSGVECGLGQNITSKDGQKVFLTAGTKVTESIKEKLAHLKIQGIISDVNNEDSLKIVEPYVPDGHLKSIVAEIKQNPVLSPFQLNETLTSISSFVMTEKLPEKITDHLTVFAKSHSKQYSRTLANLVLGTHIGRANHYSESELNELMSVLFFENIGFARLNSGMKNANMAHPILSKEIVQYAGIKNKLILESILQHEEKVDGSGFPNKLTNIHEYAQISQIVNQYSLIVKQQNLAESMFGKLCLLGQQTDFRSGELKNSVFQQNLQSPLFSIMQERLNTQDDKREYANLLYQELCHIINWCDDKSSQEPEFKAIQSKIKSALWITESSKLPFQLTNNAFNDKAICQEFITDSMKFLFLIAESADFLNQVLHQPIKREGSPISGEHLLQLANPLLHSVGR